MNKDRFWNELKIVSATKRKQTWGVLALAFFGSLALTLCITSGVFNVQPVSLLMRAESAAMASGVLVNVIALYCAVHVIGNLSDKSTQVRLLTTPATPGEIILAHVLYTWVLIAILLTLAEAAGLLLGGLITDASLSGETVRHLLGLANSNVPEELNMLEATAAGMVANVAMVLAYLLGNLYFRKNVFIYTSLILVTLFIGWMIILGVAVGLMVARGILAEPESLSPFYSVALELYAAFSLLAILVLSWWAYRKFRKMEIVAQ